MTNIVCGVDVRAKPLDASIGRDGAQHRFRRTPEGIAAPRAFCADQKVDLVVMEATGGYEKLPLGLLWAEAMPVAIVNPRTVRDFAEAMSHLDKTDRLDAKAREIRAELKPTPQNRPPGRSLIRPLGARPPSPVRTGEGRPA